MQETISRLLREIVSANADRVIQYSKDESGTFQPTSYMEFYNLVQTFAAGLHAIGVRRGDHVGLISDNRKEWLVTDQAILGIGAADVPRGCDSTAQEIQYILDFAECKVVICENPQQVEKIVENNAKVSRLKTIVLVDRRSSSETRQNGSVSNGSAGSTDSPLPTMPQGVSLLTYEEVMIKGEPVLRKDPAFFDAEIEKGKTDDVATIIFTSGTTGEPKGVVLTHGNFLFQIERLPGILDVGPGDVFVSVLPVWHSFERIIQYMILGTGMTMAYSKPIGQIMLADIATIRPTWMASVPRIWESVMTSVYRNIRAKGGISEVLFRFFLAVGGARATMDRMLNGLLPEFRRRVRIVDIVIAVVPYLLLTPLCLLGDVLVFKKIKIRLGGRFVATVSGGGALPSAVDKFFASIGILLLEGYGLTETAPVVAVRRRYHPVPSTVGPPLPDTHFRIVDDQFHDLPPGKKGLVLIKGGQVMQGYYRREDLTNKVLSPDGWFNSGDLGMTTRHGELRIMGRAKDTIVLLGGENIEPAPIEQRLKESRFIDEAVVLGQDQKFLAALVVPNRENVESYARDNSIAFIDWEGLASTPEVYEMLDQEINQLVNAKNGFKAFERIFRFRVIPNQFTVDKELSHKQEVKRHVIDAMYKKEIRALFGDRMS